MAPQDIDRFYVYSLTDPRPGSFGVFYIGKGTAARNYAHTHNVPKSAADGTPKGQRIKSILDDGHEVISTIIKRFSDEDEAYAFEKELVAATPDLTNSVEGGHGGHSKITKLVTSQKKKLTDKQVKFIEEYLIDQNATQAAIRAGYSEKTARQIASEMLSKPNIRLSIDQRLTEHRRRCEVSIDSLTEELEEARELAAQTAQPGAQVSATLGKAKLHGLLIDKSHVQMQGDLAVKLQKARERVA